MLRRDESFSKFLEKAYRMPHDQVNRLAANTPEVVIIYSDFRYMRATQTMSAPVSNFVEWLYYTANI